MKKITFIFFVSLIVSFDVAASLENLVIEYIRNNSEIKNMELKSLLATYNHQAKVFSKSWELSATTNALDSSLESATTLASTEVKTNEHTLGFNKDFFWGGQFSFLNTLGETKTGSLSKYSNFSQTLSYSQDLGSNFLGQNDKLDLSILESTQILEKLNLNAHMENEILKLINKFLSCQESAKLEYYHKKAYSRAVKREKLISKRVNDGLNLKADLYTATSARLLKKEEVEAIKLKHLNELLEISKLLHREILPSEIIDIKAPIKVHNRTFLNKSLKVVEQNIEVESLRMKQIKNTLWPKLSLTGSYTTNDYDPLKSESLDNGNIFGANSSSKIALEFVWQIGSNSAKVEKAKTFARLETLKYQKSQLAKNLELSFDFLKRDIFLRKKIIKSSEKRLNMANKTLKEYVKLYNKGRADLDQIIRSEETLIETQKSLLRAKVESERIFFSLSLLNGELLESILGTNLK